MAGTKNHSGGRREGAGAKPGTSGGVRPGAGRPVQSFTLRLGEQFYCHELGGLVEVTALDRKHLVLKTSTGEVKLVR